MNGRSRAKYIKISNFAQQYDINKSQLYSILKNEQFSSAIMKIGDKGIRVNQDLLFELMQQYYK